MKIIQRGIMKIVPGKTAEAMELYEKHMAIASRLGMPLTGMRSYRPFIGGELFHTLIGEFEWDSMTKACQS